MTKVENNFLLPKIIALKSGRPKIIYKFAFPKI